MGKVTSVLSLLLFLNPVLAQEKKTIAVLEFYSNRWITQETSIIAEHLRTYLSLSGVYKVLDKSKMEYLLREQDFLIFVALSDEIAIEVGKICHVDYVLAGDIEKKGQTHSIIARLIDVKMDTVLHRIDHQFQVSTDKLFIEGIEEFAWRVVKIEAPLAPPTELVNTHIDEIPPTIHLYEPYLSPGSRRITFEDKRVLIRGRVMDDSGVYEVLINNRDAALDQKGHYWSVIPLTPGTNSINIVATDLYNNTSEIEFILDRDIYVRPSHVTVRQGVDSLFGEYHALLIAVQEYSNKAIVDLHFPGKDIQRLKKVLQTHYGFQEKNIHLLHNPARHTILEAFNELRDVMSREDNLLVFYAGHGYWDEEISQGYWLPSDAQPNNQFDWISNSSIRDMISAINTQHTLLISDACFSGGIFKTRTASILPDISFQKVYQMPSRKAITSGYLSAVPDRSVFIEHLIERLEVNEEAFLYSEKLYILIRDAVIINSPNFQTPLFGSIVGTGDEGGDFIFIRK